MFTSIRVNARRYGVRHEAVWLSRRTGAERDADGRGLACGHFLKRLPNRYAVEVVAIHLAGGGVPVQPRANVDVLALAVAILGDNGALVPGAAGVDHDAAGDGVVVSQREADKLTVDDEIAGGRGGNVRVISHDLEVPASACTKRGDLGVVHYIRLRVGHALSPPWGVVSVHAKSATVQAALSGASSAALRGYRAALRRSIIASLRPSRLARARKSSRAASRA